MTDQSTTTTALLDVRGVSVAYGEQTVLRDIDLTIQPGTVTALLGPNGAGKTTLLRAIAGLQPCAQGSISVDGEDVTSRAAQRRVRSGVCLVPEGRGVFRSLTVRENLLAQRPAWLKGSDVSPAIDAFPVLGERLNQVAGTMSGGQQQMLALARCYLSEPRIILLDEVSMGLAPLVIDQIFESIGRLADRGVSLLVVEQYVDRALDMASTVYILNRGTVVHAGPTAEIDRDELVASYLGAQV